ncbi:hypothetical protein BJX64DRAFT_253826 [Aspergillus heterothallicus]
MLLLLLPPLPLPLVVLVVRVSLLQPVPSPRSPVLVKPLPPPLLPLPPPLVAVERMLLLLLPRLLLLLPLLVVTVSMTTAKSGSLSTTIRSLAAPAAEMARLRPARTSTPLANMTTGIRPPADGSMRRTGLKAAMSRSRHANDNRTHS